MPDETAPQTDLEKALMAQLAEISKDRDKWQAAYNELKNSAKAKKSAAYQ
jgi:hypothetical protein